MCLLHTHTHTYAAYHLLPKKSPNCATVQLLKPHHLRFMAQQGGHAVMLLPSIGTTTTMYIHMDLPHSHSPPPHTHSLGLCNYFVHCSRIVRLLFAQKRFFVRRWKAKCCQGICAGQKEMATMRATRSARKTIDQPVGCGECGG